MLYMSLKMSFINTQFHKRTATTQIITICILHVTTFPVTSDQVDHFFHPKQQNINILNLFNTTRKDDL
jgi:hypothetical protein